MPLARMKEVLAQALAEAAAPVKAPGDPQEQLRRDIAELEKTSERGSD